MSPILTAQAIINLQTCRNRELAQPQCASARRFRRFKLALAAPAKLAQARGWRARLTAAAAVEPTAVEPTAVESTAEPDAMSEDEVVEVAKTVPAKEANTRGHADNGVTVIPGVIRITITILLIPSVILWKIIRIALRLNWDGCR
jgi:hypothetical protein